MSLSDEITAAVGAHGLWKQRLRQAIDTGRSDVTPDMVRVDNKCKVGMWLYGPNIPGAQKASQDYRRCQDLHAKFHTAAAKALELALSGKKAEAEAAIGPGSEFITLSHQLTDAMLKWQKVAA